MKIFNCIICNSFSFEIICKNCQKKYLKPTLKQKDDIIYFYEYEEIDFLLKYKYHKFGDSIFHILAKNSLSLFAKEIKEYFYLIPIEDKKRDFSHTAILAKHMKTKYLKPLFSSLIATTDITYAGKSLQYRKENPRNFKYSGPKNIDAILIDDIATTHTTIKEAKETLKEYGVNVYLSVVLAHS